MEEQTNEVDDHEVEETEEIDWDESLEKITPLSRFLALLLIAAILFFGFWLAYNYQNNQLEQVLQVNQPTIDSNTDEDTINQALKSVNNLPETTNPFPDTSNWQTYKSEEYGFEFRHSPHVRTERSSLGRFRPEQERFDYYIPVVDSAYPAYSFLTIIPEAPVDWLADTLSLVDRNNIELTEEYLSDPTNTHAGFKNTFLGIYSHDKRTGVGVSHKEFDETEYYIFDNYDNSYFVYVLNPVRISTVDGSKVDFVVEPGKAQEDFVASFNFATSTRTSATGVISFDMPPGWTTISTFGGITLDKPIEWKISGNALSPPDKTLSDTYHGDIIIQVRDNPELLSLDEYYKSQTFDAIANANSVESTTVNGYPAVTLEIPGQFEEVMVAIAIEDYVIEITDVATMHQDDGIFWEIVESISPLQNE